MELAGIKGLWALRESAMDAFDTFLVLSFVGETRILAISANDELDEAELPGFNADAQVRVSRDSGLSGFRVGGLPGQGLGLGTLNALMRILAISADDELDEAESRLNVGAHVDCCTRILGLEQGCACTCPEPHPGWPPALTTGRTMLSCPWCVETEVRGVCWGCDERKAIA